MNPQEQSAAIARGERARSLVENPDLKQAFETIRRMLLENVAQATGPEDAWMAVTHIKAHARIWMLLVAWLSGGESALRERMDEQKQLERDSGEEQAFQSWLEQAESEREKWSKWEYIPPDEVV